MIDPKVFFDTLKNRGIDFFTGVPDSLLKNFCSCLLSNVSKKQNIIAANEGNAVGIGVGYHLATNKIPLVYLQNSGLGNIINPLLSIVDREIYSIPMLFLVGWRGEPGVKDEPQHKKQGKVTLPLLESMEIPYKILSSDMREQDIKETIRVSITSIKKESAPFMLVVKKNVFNKFQASETSDEDSQICNREQAVIEILSSIRKDDIVVSTTGMISREVFEYRQKKGFDHKTDFLTIGGMGHANQIATGIALQKPEKQVICIDGDGAALMHLGSLCINGSLGCLNYKHIILNNSAHDSVGGQPTVGDQVDFTSIAKASGYKLVKQVADLKELKSSLKQVIETDGPSLLEVRVKKGARPDLGRPTNTPFDNKKLFMDFLKNG